MRICGRFFQRKAMIFMIIAAVLGLFLINGCAKKAMMLNPPQAKNTETELANEKGFNQSNRFGKSPGGNQDQGFMISEELEKFAEKSPGLPGLNEETPSPFGFIDSQTESGIADSSNDFMPSNKESSNSQIAKMLPFRSTSDLNDVYFKFDKYDLDMASKSILQKNAEWLKQHPEVKIEIQGHADERGTSNYNLGLGERRAQSVKNYLMALGIEKRRLFAISFGEEKPFCNDSNEDCWWQNRRGHFLVAISENDRS